jgi:hypothetical protein
LQKVTKVKGKKEEKKTFLKCENRHFEKQNHLTIFREVGLGWRWGWGLGAGGWGRHTAVSL